MIKQAVRAVRACTSDSKLHRALHRLAKGNPRVLEELLIELAACDYQLDKPFDRKLLDLARRIYNAADLAAAQLAGKNA